MRHRAELPHRRQVDRHDGVRAQAVQRLAGPYQQHGPAALVHSAAGGGGGAVNGEFGDVGGRGEGADPLGDRQHDAS